MPSYRDWSKIDKRTAFDRFGTEFVYFARAGEYVKIGFSGWPEKRMKSIQTGCPLAITLQAKMPGTLKTELATKRRFSEYRVRRNGEWFRYEGELKVFIESLTDGK